MSFKFSIVALFLLAVSVGCGDGAATSAPAGDAGAAPAEAPIEPVKSTDDPSTP